jgi:uncharacterized protein (UPF0332 family)
VTPAIEARLERGRRELAAIRVLADAGFATQAVSRAYYAAFYAAEAALPLGQSRSKHAGVIAAFVEYVVKGGGLDRGCGRILNTLFERRNAADYDEKGAANPDDADAAIEQAEMFVDAVAKWLEARSAS